MKTKKIFAFFCSFALAVSSFGTGLKPGILDFKSVSASENDEEYSAGDINGDGMLNVFDLNRLNRYLSGSLELDENELKRADFNYDGAVNYYDLSLMSGNLTMRLEKPKDHNGKRLIFESENCYLKKDEINDINFTLSIPDDWLMNSIKIYLDDVMIDSLAPSLLKKIGKTTYGHYSYTVYTGRTRIKDSGNSDGKGFSRTLSAEMSNQMIHYKSNQIILYREVENVEEVIDKSGVLLDELSDFVSQVSETDSSCEYVFSEVKNWLESSENFTVTGITNDMIEFNTAYGLSSYFEILDDDNTEENGLDEPSRSINNLNTLNEIQINRINSIYNAYSAVRASENEKSNEGKGDDNEWTGPTQGSDELLKKYKETAKLDNGSGRVLTVMDPDVLYFCTVPNTPATWQNSYRYPETAEKINNLVSGGSYDEKSGAEYCKWEEFQNWNQYGTVLWNTHGNVRADGRTIYQVYSGDDSLETAKELVRSLSEIMTMTEFDGSAAYLDDISLGIQYSSGGLFHEDSVCIGSGVLMRLLEDVEFPNTVFYFSACYGLCDSILNDFLISHGAAAVIGYYDEDSIDTSMQKYLFDHATKWKSRNPDISNSLIDSVNVANFKFALKNIILPMNYYLMTHEVNIYSEKDFHYVGHGMMKGSVYKYGAEEKEGIEGVTVDAYRYYNGEMKFVDSATTDSKGIFTFKDDSALIWGYYLLHVYNDEAETFVKADFTDISNYVGDIFLGIASDGTVPADMIKIWDYVRGFYTNMFGREGSELEINSWTGQLMEKRTTVADMARWFYESDEYIGDSLSNLDFVKMCYRTLHRREPERQAVLYWPDKLSLGTFTREYVFKYGVNSEELRRTSVSLGIEQGFWD